MAASFSLRRIETSRIWLSLVVLFVALFAVQAHQIYRDSRIENQQIVDSQLRTLLRARIADLQAKNYRNFVEGVGEEFKELRVTIDAGSMHFRVGPENTFENCASSVLSLDAAAKVDGVTIQICRKYSSPMVRFSVLVPIFLVMVWFGYLLKRSEIETKKKRALFEISVQVAHDIRAPLAALRSFEAGLSEVAVENRLIVRSAISRIDDIANDLLNRYRVGAPLQKLGEESESQSVENISEILAALLMEKRLQFRSKKSVKIGAHQEFALQASASIQPIEFGRLVSNLINNAVEACENSGNVQIALFADGRTNRIVIQDNGKGIPPDVLPNLGLRGETHGKLGGSGLGLFHAMEAAKRWGGSLSVESTLGVGTSVTLSLPAVTS